MKNNPSFHLLFPVAAIFLLAVLVVWILWGNTALTVSTFMLESARIPTAFSGFRIAQISDLHNAEFGEGNAKLLRRLEESAPDIIVITGDLIDARRPDIETALHFVREAVKLAPVYYVSGNHEARLPQYHVLRNRLKEAGAGVLENEAVPLKQNGGEITLIGLSDPKFVKWKNVTNADNAAIIRPPLEKLLPADKIYSIVLSHRPELFETYVDCGADLVFTGHAHGGQFRFPFIGGLFAPNQGFFPKYDSGLYTEGKTNMIVSRGLGASVIPIRFHNRPELIIAELRHADA